jgi:hypothetical protein
VQRIGELFPGPSKATRAYLHAEEDIEAALKVCNIFHMSGVTAALLQIGNSGRFLTVFKDSTLSVDNECIRALVGMHVLSQRWHQIERKPLPAIHPGFQSGRFGKQQTELFHLKNQPFAD